MKRTTLQFLIFVVSLDFEACNRLSSSEGLSDSKKGDFSENKNKSKDRNYSRFHILISIGIVCASVNAVVCVSSQKSIQSAYDHFRLVADKVKYEKCPNVKQDKQLLIEVCEEMCICALNRAALNSIIGLSLGS